MRRKNVFINLLLSSFMVLSMGCMANAEGAAPEPETTAQEDIRAGGRMNDGPKMDSGGKHGNGEKRGMRGGNGGGMVENEEEIQSIIDANAEKFEQFVYEDSENGLSLEYSIYIPEDYDESRQYPLIMFIPDSTGSGKSAKEIVEQYYGADVWVTDEEQEKHASFVIVPAFTETVVEDNWNTSEQIGVAVHLINELQETYSIDADRLYTTGQSMGCMTSLYLNSIYPDMFAASMYVSGQWDITVLSPLKEQKFFYITAGGDEKASGGQDEVMQMFDRDGSAYTYDTWNAQNSQEEQDLAVTEMLKKGTNANMIRFETGSVFKDGQSKMEHMASFNYAYKLTAVRDWLFEQSKKES